MTHGHISLWNKSIMGYEKSASYSTKKEHDFLLNNPDYSLLNKPITVYEITVNQKAYFCLWNILIVAYETISFIYVKENILWVWTRFIIAFETSLFYKCMKEFGKKH